MKRFILISYDITDARRLQRVHKLVSGYADRIQYSVFLGQLSEKDEAILRERLYDMIDKKEDQVIMIRLGIVDQQRKPELRNWNVLGKKVVLSDTRIMIL